MKHIIRISFLALAIASITLATAHAGKQNGMDEAALSSWEQMVMLESCMNGDASASGLYPSQITEEKSFATLGILADLTSP